MTHPPLVPSLLSITHSHSFICSPQHFLCPHTYSSSTLLLVLPTHVSQPLWPECVMNRPSDNTFFFYPAALAITLPDTLFLVHSLCFYMSLPFSTSDLLSLVTVAIFWHKVYNDRLGGKKTSTKKKSGPVDKPAHCLSGAFGSQSYIYV